MEVFSRPSDWDPHKAAAPAIDTRRATLKRGAESRRAEQADSDKNKWAYFWKLMRGRWRARKFGKPELIPELEAAAKRDPVLIPLVQDARRLMDSIGKQNFPAFVDAVIDTDEWEDILPLLMVTWRPLVDLLAQKQRGPAVRLRAVKMLAWGHTPRGGENLSAIVADPLEPADLRLEAIMTLGRSRIRSSAQALDPLLKKWIDRGGAYRESLRLAIRRSCAVSGSEFLKDLLKTGGVLLLATYLPILVV